VGAIAAGLRLNPAAAPSGRAARVDSGSGSGKDPKVAGIESPDGAKRLARTIASDISLYNEAKVLEAIRNDNLFDALAPEIEEGLQLYRSRVSPEILARTNFYHRAIIDILLRNKGNVQSNMW